MLAGKGADIVVLDLGLPDRDGIDILKELRRWSRVPVIVLTVRSGEGEQVALLDAGANDYVTKPSGCEVFIARIRAFLRANRLRGECGCIYHDGNLPFYLSKRVARIQGQPGTLT